MGLFTLEHSQRSHRADFVLYGSAVLLLAAYLLLEAPREVALRANPRDNEHADFLEVDAHQEFLKRTRRH